MYIVLFCKTAVYKPLVSLDLDKEGKRERERESSSAGILKYKFVGL